MGTGPSAKRQIHLRLVHDGVQPGTPLDEPLRFGLQDGKGEVFPGLTQPGRPQNFDFVLEVSEGDEANQPVFRGMFAHGPPKGRFVYLSWKRHGVHEHPWGWRIKIPLSGIGWADIRAAEKPGSALRPMSLAAVPMPQRQSSGGSTRRRILNSATSHGERRDSGYPAIRLFAACRGRSALTPEDQH